MALADGADLGPVTVGWDDDAAGPLDRFGNESRHPVFTEFLYLFLKLSRHLLAEVIGRQVAAFAVPVGLANVDDIWDGQATLSVHSGHATQTRASYSAAVIGVAAADNDLFFRMPHAGPEITRHADDGVV